MVKQDDLINMLQNIQINSKDPGPLRQPGSSNLPHRLNSNLLRPDTKKNHIIMRNVAGFYQLIEQNNFTEH